MKTPFANTNLEIRLLSKRDPRSAIAASSINLHGTNVRPQCNTNHLLSDIQDEENTSDNESFAFYASEL